MRHDFASIRVTIGAIRPWEERCGARIGPMRNGDQRPSAVKPAAQILPYAGSRTGYVEYDPGTVGAAAQAVALIESAVPWVEVEHIGSTAVPGCAGKGIVDLMALYPPDKLEATRAAIDGI